jgi:hypothetical protein
MLGFSITRDLLPVRWSCVATASKERAAQHLPAALDSSIRVDLAGWCLPRKTGHPLDYHFGLRVLVALIFLDFFSLADFFDAMESPSI